MLETAGLLEAVRQSAALWCGHIPLSAWPAARAGLDQAGADYAALKGHGGEALAVVATAQPPGGTLIEWPGEAAAAFLVAFAQVAVPPARLSAGWARLTKESPVQP